MRKFDRNLQVRSNFSFRNQVLLVLAFQLFVTVNSCRGAFIIHSYFCHSYHQSLLENTRSNMSSSHTDDIDANVNERGKPTEVDTKAAIEFARLLGRLKVTPRTGWVRRGVPKWESVADHSWRVAALSLLLPQDYDLNKSIAMGVLHDVAEALVGDICPDDNVSKEEKARMEAEATETIASILDRAGGDASGDSSNDSACTQQMLSLLHEYEQRESKEAIGVKDLDLLDMIIQAAEYEERFGLDLGDFFDGTPVDRFRTPAIQAIADEVHNERIARIESQQNNERAGQNGDSLSESDAAFVEEYAKASGMTTEMAEQTVKALRAWDRDQQSSD